ncbi:hypothetical protein FB548_3093 [Pseudoxanthomonas sp. 3HH-4]|uniref:hypothetical protein n=1 Tax=Pseudoxanthomonas sp. 3HH-4 TaxID=1690214 RepID=UPI0011682B17|nr:hypothetical protein [Pseudoxanthomonas sp. 3HH-4]TQM06720.1 hypothetical protein FB548_3093 [Pseudoxanthomonas sp. 3HH-4]
MVALIPSSQRTLGPMLMFARSMTLAGASCEIKLDASMHGDDDAGLELTRMKIMSVAAA